MEWDIHYSEVTGSTNDDAVRLGKAGYPDHTVCTAGSQTAGRGRMDRKWFSPPGRGLYISALIRPGICPDEAGLLSFCAANAMAETIRRNMIRDVELKWPNDVLVRRKKVCGILSSCEIRNGRLEFAVIGAGLNLCKGSYPQELAGRATSLEENGLSTEEKSQVRDHILHQYLNFLDQEVQSLTEEGPGGVVERFAAQCVTIGREVRVLDLGGEETAGTGETVRENGNLLLRLADGTLKEVLNGDVSVRGAMDYV